MAISTNTRPSLKTIIRHLAAGSSLLVALLPVGAHAQVPGTLGACSYVQGSRDYFYCPSGPTVQVALAPGATADYVFTYPAHMIMGGALQLVMPRIYFTAQIDPVDPSTSTTAGIAIYDSESSGAAGAPDTNGIMRAAPPQLVATVALFPLVDHPNTVQASYTSAKDGPVDVRLFNNSQLNLMFTFDQSGTMQGNRQLEPLALTLVGGQGASGCQFIQGFKTLYDFAARRGRRLHRQPGLRRQW